MAPLILHNVPDDELYVGEDGVQRPYAIIFSHDNGPATSLRPRRAVPETGAFGKTTRRSRSKTATPARREDPTIQNAHKVFAAYFDRQNAALLADAALSQKQRRASSGQPQPQPNNASAPADDASSPPDAAHHAAVAARNIPRVPTEVVLRGFRDVDQQYAAINRYEHIAGRICEDYPRDPPHAIRRYKSDLRDPARAAHRAPLTPDERAKVNRADSGAHWVKVTLESQQAADAALFASPQAVLGHLVFAELYRGMGPARDEPVPDASALAQGDGIPAAWRRAGEDEGRLPERTVAGGRGDDGEDDGMRMDMSPPRSHASSRTVESGTVGGATGASSSPTATTTTAGAGTGAFMVNSSSGGALTTAAADQADSVYCRMIPTARKAVLLPAEQALLPQPSLTSRVLSQIPFLKWFSGSMIGSQVPRTAEGEFDWVGASLYWKVICWLDLYFGLFSGDIVTPEKDD